MLISFVFAVCAYVQKSNTPFGAGGRRMISNLKKHGALPELTETMVFTDGFMRDVVQSRMLIEQRKR